MRHLEPLLSIRRLRVALGRHGNASQRVGSARSHDRGIGFMRIQSAFKDNAVSYRPRHRPTSMAGRPPGYCRGADRAKGSPKARP